MKRRRWFPILCLTMLAAPVCLRAAEPSKVQVKEKKRHEVLFAPSGYEKVVLLLAKGKEYKYYLFSSAAPLKLEIAGPTKLDISVRLLYEVSMKGIQEYALKIEEEGLLGKLTEVSAHNLKARKSSTSTIKDQPKVVPSKADILNLAVPEGKHAYRITLAAAQAKTALIRIMVPAADLKVSKKKEKKP